MVQALQEGDEIRANAILSELIPRLKRFLQIHMGARESDAEDCVQHSLELALDVIRRDKVKNPDKILTYLMTTCRNNYLKEQNKWKDFNYEYLPKDRFTRARQFQSLVDEERKEILKQCLDELKEEHRRFIDYLLAHPDSDADKVAEHFDISVNNVWIRKHRIIKQLNECYRIRSNQ